MKSEDMKDEWEEADAEQQQQVEELQSDEESRGFPVSITKKTKDSYESIKHPKMGKY